MKSSIGKPSIDLGDIITYTHTGDSYRKYWGMVIPVPSDQRRHLERPDEWICVKWLGEPPHSSDQNILNKNVNIVKKHSIDEKKDPPQQRNSNSGS